MLEDPRTLRVGLPDAWEEDAAPLAAPPTPSLARAGMRLRTAGRSTHTADGSTVVIYRARATATAFRTVEAQLARAAGAARLNGRLTWAVGGEDWLSLNFLQPAAETGGPALLWSSYLPAATAQQRVPELLRAAEQTRWSEA